MKVLVKWLRRTWTLFHTCSSKAELFVLVWFGLEGDLVVDGGWGATVSTCPAVIKVTTTLQI